MIKISLKNFRILIISICSGATYLFMEFSDRVKDTFNLLSDSHSSKGLGVLIFLHIVKYAALIFSVVALIIFLKVSLFKKNNKN